MNDPDNIVVCAGDSVGPIEFESTVEAGTTTYEWEIIDGDGLSNGSDIGLTQTDFSSGVINEFTSINGGSEPLEIEIKVTPTFSNGDVDCSPPIETFTITVNPVPQIDDSLNNAICHNESYTYSPVNGDDGVVPSGVTYSWGIPDTTDPTVQGTSGTNQNEFTTGIIENDDLNVAATLTYTVTPTILATGCEGEDFTVTIIVNPCLLYTSDAADE